MELKSKQELLDVKRAAMEAMNTSKSLDEKKYYAQIASAAGILASGKPAVAADTKADESVVDDAPIEDPPVDEKPAYVRDTQLQLQEADTRKHKRKKRRKRKRTDAEET